MAQNIRQRRAIDAMSPNDKLRQIDRRRNPGARGLSVPNILAWLRKWWNFRMEW